MGSWNISPAKAFATESEEISRIGTYSIASYCTVRKTLDTQVKISSRLLFAQFSSVLKLTLVSFLFLF